MNWRSLRTSHAVWLKLAGADEVLSHWSPSKQELQFDLANKRWPTDDELTTFGSAQDAVE